MSVRRTEPGSRPAPRPARGNSRTTAVRRPERRLGDFTVTRRMLVIAGFALPVGALSACVAWALLRLIGLITNLVFYHRVDTALVAPDATHHSAALVVIAPIVGGLVIGLMARYGSEKIRGHGMPEAIEAILMGGSKVQPRVAILKPVSAAIAIGTGGPFGAEGPIIMTGGAFGSLVAQHLRLTADERKTLLVAGAAGGMAATFNAPFASILLAVELLLFEWRPRSLVPVSTSVVVATIVRHFILGYAPIFPVPAITLHIDASTYGLCLVSGIIAGLLAVVATTLVYFAEDTFHRLPVHWMWWPALGGLIIGIGGLFVPQALGVGYDIIGAELDGTITLKLVIGVLIVKTLIWSLSLGSGTSGGVLAPMFMIGGALGAAEASFFPPVAPGFWALVGLAGVLGGVMRSPLTGVIFAIELTGRLDAMLPLIVAATAAYAMSVLVLKRSVLTEKIARRGYHLSREYSVDPLEVLFVREVMTTDVVTFVTDTPMSRVTETFLTARRQLSGRQHRQRLYPVVDPDGKLAGVISRRDILNAALDPDTAAATVDDLLVRNPVIAHADETLREVSYRMAERRVTRLPVVSRSNPNDIVGIVSLAQLLEGRLRDLQEERETERVLHFRALLPVGPGRWWIMHHRNVEDDETAEPAGPNGAHPHADARPEPREPAGR